VRKASAKGKQGVWRWAELASTPAPAFAAAVAARHARVCILVPSLVFVHPISLFLTHDVFPMSHVININRMGHASDEGVLN
jgi:hypothetical protein